MDIDTLGLVQDDFTDGEQERLDTRLGRYPELTPEDIPYLGPAVLSVINQELGARATSEYASLGDFWRLIESEPRLQKMLLEDSPRDYTSVRLLKILRKGPQSDEPSGEDTSAIESTGLRVEV
ncbi:hypothetical protein OG21DRAFT_1512979 [Imleria badia]|nr:hypothetical protein OG21DRAFT_1512979 [Imleria badia]